MTHHWTFEAGQIVARDDAGTLILAIPVEKDQGIHGPLLADFIDRNTVLGERILAGYGYCAKPT